MFYVGNHNPFLFSLAFIEKNNKFFCIEVEGIDNASVIKRHLSVGITAETVIKPIITNSFNSVHT
jgi:hypothetical protein